MENNNKLSSGKAWALFIIAMVVVFGLGLLTSALMERRAEVASIFNNRKAPFTGEKIHAQNEDFRTDFPREYDTWRQTLETNYDSKPLDVNNPNREGVVPQMYHNGNEATDVLAYRPNMVVLWAGYAFSWDYTTPRGHMHTVEDMTRTLRTGAPDTETTGSNQPGTCWTCKSPDVPRIMSEKGVAEYYKANWAMWGNEIANPADFQVTDEIFNEFKAFINADKFEYDKVCEQQLATLRKTATAEGYMNDSIQAQFDLLEQMLKHDLDHDLDLHRRDITYLIGQEIMDRLYYQRGQVQNAIKDDDYLDAAKKMFDTTGEYQRILNISTKKGKSNKKKK